MDTETATIETSARVHPGLSGYDYHNAKIYDLDRERIFHRQWFGVCREQHVLEAGEFVVGDVAGESVIVARDHRGNLNAFYNVCQHRGSILCDDVSGRVEDGFTCPYHAWFYGLDGRLLRTPYINADAGLNLAELGLRSVAVEVWDGFVFVNLSSNPKPLHDQLRQSRALRFERYRIGELRVGRRIDYEVKANWKIVIENFGECLHCPGVHPELTKVVPHFRTGRVRDSEHAEGGVWLNEGMYTFTFDGRSKLPQLPGLSETERKSYYGCTLFPNMLLNMMSTGVMSYTLFPRAVDHTTVISEYLFRSDVIESADFNCTDMVDFFDLVSRQDWGICEGVQRGITSRGFDRVVHPEPDSHAFVDRYRAERDQV